MTTFLLQAEMRLAVVGTLSGNDYAQNPRGMALKRICNMVKDNKYKDYNKANELMDKVNIKHVLSLYVPGTHFPIIISIQIIEDIPRIYEYDRSRYKQALLQFCSPYVLTSSGDESTRVTFSSIRIDIDQDLLNNMYEDTKPASSKGTLYLRYTMCTILTECFSNSQSKSGTWQSLYNRHCQPNTKVNNHCGEARSCHRIKSTKEAIQRHSHA